MKLPIEIKSRHKIRDAAILHLFLTENLTLNELGSRFNLTGSRCQQILYDNKHLISWEKNYEKAVRINALKRMHQKYESVLGKKSSIDILEQIRKEIEGDKPLIDNSIHNYKTFVYLDQKAKEEDSAKSNRIASELPAV